MAWYSAVSEVTSAVSAVSSAATSPGDHPDGLIATFYLPAAWYHKHKLIATMPPARGLERAVIHAQGVRARPLELQLGELHPRAVNT